MRRRKLLLALQAVKRARALEPASPEAHVLLLRFCHAVQPHQQQQQKVRAAHPPCMCTARNPHEGMCAMQVLPSVKRPHGSYGSSTLCD